MSLNYHEIIKSTPEMIKEMVDVMLDLLSGEEVYWDDVYEFRELRQYAHLLDAIKLIETLGIDLAEQKKRLMKDKKWAVKRITEEKNNG